MPEEAPLEMIDGDRRLDVIVSTSNEYRDLVPGFAARFNRHWPGPPVPVTILCYEVPDMDRIPENFRAVTLGVQPDRMIWTTKLRRYIQKLPWNAWTLLMLEDYWLTADVDTEKIQNALRAANNEGAAKLDISGEVARHPHKAIEGTPLIAAAKTAPYKAALQAAFWRNAFLYNQLGKARNIWNFETECSENLKRSEALVVGTAEPLMIYDNVAKKGIINPEKAVV